MPQALDFWQEFTDHAPPPPWRDAYPAPLPDGRHLLLPLRDLGDTAVAGLIANQASFTVLDALVGLLAAEVSHFDIDLVLGLPTLGHVVAAGLARELGHHRWVPAGYSRKLWYDEALSVPVSSITTPDARRLWLDPRTLPLLAGRRVMLVDDVISTGRSIQAGLALMQAAGLRPVACACLMTQTDRWRPDFPPDLPVSSAFATPLFRRTPQGWTTP